MPRRKSSILAQRLIKKKHLQNLRIKRHLKTALKKFQELVSAKNAAEAKTFLPKLFSQLDKAAKKRVLHPRMARRKKSRLALSLGKLAKKAA